MGYSLPSPCVLTWAVLRAACRDTTPSARWDRAMLHSPHGLGAMAPRAAVSLRRHLGKLRRNAEAGALKS